MELSIIICTYNRAELLDLCLLSLLSMEGEKKEIEIIVVDNSSIDSTIEVCKKYKEVLPNFKYIYEGRIGLSSARNKGAEESQGKWLAYIDDDVKVHPNFLLRALWVTNNFDFDCFGGMCLGWFKYGKPKWLRENTFDKVSPVKKVGLIDTPIISGMNFFIRKAMLDEFGGFKPYLGMNGGKIAYGEETEIQVLLLKSRYKLGFDPELQVDHIVMKHKLRFSWHIKKEFTQGRDNQRYMKRNFVRLLKLSIVSIGGVLLKRLPSGLLNILSKKKYYWQNFTLDVLSPIIYRSGCWYAFFFIKD